MNLHDQPIFQAHLRHLRQHLGTEEFLLPRIGVAGQHPAKELRCLGRGQVGGLRSGMPVVGCRAAERAETRACLAQGVQVAWPHGCVFSGLLAQLLNQTGKSRELRIDHRIRPEGGTILAFQPDSRIAL